MPVYLSTMTNGGRGGLYPAGARLAPAGTANWILLRWLTPAKAFLWTDSPVSDPGATFLADTLDEPLPANTRLGLGNAEGVDRTFRVGTSIRDVIIDLCTAPSTHVQWGRLRGTNRTGRYEIWFGPGGRGKNLMYSAPFERGPSTKVFNDDFNRTVNLNGSTASGPGDAFTWTEVQGTAVTINGTEAIAAGVAGWNVAKISAVCDTASHFAEAVIGTYTWTAGGAVELGVVVKAYLLDGSATEEGYYFSIGKTSVPVTYREIRDFHTDAVLATDATATSSGTMRLEIDGSSLTAKVNGATTHGPVTDASPYTTANGLGMTFFSTAAGTSVGFTSWAGGDLGSTANLSVYQQAFTGFAA